MYSPDGAVIVTNDGATILDKMEVGVNHILYKILNYLIGPTSIWKITSGTFKILR